VAVFRAADFFAPVFVVLVGADPATLFFAVDLAGVLLADAVFGRTSPSRSRTRRRSELTSSLVATPSLAI
jgi:hypothetical protein